MNREWLTSPYGVLIFICVGYLANTTALAVADAWTLIRWLKRRRSRPVPASGTPAAMIQRHTVRTPPTPRGPHMPDDNEITRRVGTPDYGPRYVEPGPVRTPADNHGQRRTRPDRRGLVAGVVVLVVLLVAGVAAGAYFLGQRGSATSAPTKAASVVVSPTYDGATLQACKSAVNAGRSSAIGNPEAKTARAAAAVSDQVALREIAQRNDHPEASGQVLDDLAAQTAAAEILTWCIYHKLGKVG